MGQMIQQFNISYHRSRRAKNVRITIAPTQAITVTVPAKVSLECAKDFVQSKWSWIQKHLTKIRHMETLQAEQPRLSRDELIKAQDELFARLEYFSKKHDLTYRRAAFRCQKTKWGSCSGQNNISLNVNMVFLPKHLQDYLLLHELCHIPHKNHGKEFWVQLDRCCGGNARAFAKELKNHRMKIRA
jgi:predicted metal-dependent hydrolase